MSKRIYRPRRKDANQSICQQAAEDDGWKTHDTHELGGGFPDFVASKTGINVLVEVKRLGEDLTPEEEKFHANWPGTIIVAYTAAGTVAQLRKARNWPAG